MKDRLGPLGDRPEHGDHVHHLMGFLVQPLGISLSGEHQHGGTIHVCIGDSGDEIGGSGSQRAERSGRVSGQTAVDLGHKSSALFMSAEDESDLFGLLKRYHEVGILFAGHSKDVLDAFRFQALNKQV